jgi:hypothetical protein
MSCQASLRIAPFKNKANMIFTIYDWNDHPTEVLIPDDTKDVYGITVSGDEVLISPVLRDSSNTRIEDYVEDYWHRVLVDGELVNDEHYLD